MRPIGTHDSRTNQNPIVAKEIPKMRLHHGWRCHSEACGRFVLNKA
jgi:hypothetical protein